MIPAAAFALDVMAVTGRTLAQGLARFDPGAMPPAQRASLVEAREGAKGTMVSMLDLSFYTGIRPASGLIVARALARNAGMLAAMITPAQRQAVLARARIARAALPGARAELDQLMAALSVTACTGLCAL